MKLKVLLAALPLLGSPLASMAQDVILDGNFLKIETATGFEVLDLDKVDRLTFTSGRMIATDKDQNQIASFPQTELSQMWFDETNGLYTISAEEAAKATFSFCAATRTLTMLAPGAIDVYAASGAHLVGIPAMEQGQTLRLTGLQPGIVIIKSGNFTAKALLK